MAIDTGQRLVIPREVRGDDIVATRAQLGLHPVPVPADVASAVDLELIEHRPFDSGVVVLRYAARG